MMFKKYRPLRCGNIIGQKGMNSSKRYLLQAEIEYWHEMLRINRTRLSRNKEQEMRACLKRAVRTLNSNELGDMRAVA
jgi:hypothetical protein